MNKKVLYFLIMIGCAIVHAYLIMTISYIENDRTIFIFNSLLRSFSAIIVGMCLSLIVRK